MAEISEIMKAKIAAKREQIRLGEQLAALQDQINEQRLEALRSRKELATAQAVTKKTKALARKAVGIAQRTQGQLIESQRMADALAHCQQRSTPSLYPSVVPWLPPLHAVNRWNGWWPDSTSTAKMWKSSNPRP
ncbi:hypothetical protein ACB288_18395 [Aeromonas taiwanensis]